MFYKKRPREKPQIAMAPLIDMVFLLLIFFMVATVFPDKVGVKVEKPEADTSKALPRHHLLFAIDRQGVLHHSERTLSYDEAEGIISAAVMAKPDIAVIVEPDKSSVAGQLVHFLDKARIAGAKNVSIATRPEYEK
ncbi:MAG: biopolymer transporter ExbD [Nitrospinota bacterium]|nr:biopolymer transporter ExbD [Nitrospinota bacterium]MDH5678547.1 biopolymer transporter ExbD [Nitrospinota bacterium]